MALSDAEVSSEEGVFTGGAIVGWFSEKALAEMVKALPVPCCGGLGVPRERGMGMRGGESKRIADVEGKGSESISSSSGRWLIGAVDCMEEALEQVAVKQAFLEEELQRRSVVDIQQSIYRGVLGHDSVDFLFVIL